MIRATLFLLIVFFLIGCSPSLNSEFTVADMPSKRQEVGSVTLNNEVIIIGGINERTEGDARVEAYNLKTNTWRSLPDLPKKLHHVGATIVDNTIYSIGGFETQRGLFHAVNSVYAFENNEWVEKAPMPTKRGGLNAVTLQGKIYAIGGNNDSDSLGTVEIYDPQTDTWTSGSSLGFGSDHAIAEVINDKIYFIGGRDASDCYRYRKKCRGITNQNTVEVFDPEKGIWQREVAQIMPRSGMGSTAKGNAIYIFGGESSTEVFTTLEIIDTADFRTIITQQLPVIPRHGVAIELQDNNLFLFAGGNKPGYGAINTTEKITLS